jgi:vacuolar-type H+-ATPase subunit B/Vma2
LRTVLKDITLPKSKQSTSPSGRQLEYPRNIVAIYRVFAAAELFKLDNDQKKPVRPNKSTISLAAKLNALGQPHTGEPVVTASPHRELSGYRILPVTKKAGGNYGALSI